MDRIGQWLRDDALLDRLVHSGLVPVTHLDNPQRKGLLVHTPLTNPEEEDRWRGLISRQAQLARDAPSRWLGLEAEPVSTEGFLYWVYQPAARSLMDEIKGGATPSSPRVLLAVCQAILEALSALSRHPDGSLLQPEALQPEAVLFPAGPGKAPKPDFAAARLRLLSSPGSLRNAGDTIQRALGRLLLQWIRGQAWNVLISDLPDQSPIWGRKHRRLNRRWLDFLRRLIRGELDRETPEGLLAELERRFARQNRGLILILLASGLAVSLLIGWRFIIPPRSWVSGEVLQLLRSVGLGDTANLIAEPEPTTENLRKAKAAIETWMNDYRGPSVPPGLPYRDEITKSVTAGKGRLSWTSAEALGKALANEQQRRERLTNELQAIEGVYRDPTASLQPDEKLEWERFRGQWTTIYPEGFIALVRAELTNQLARILPPNPDSSLGLGDWQGWFQAAATNLGGLASDLSMPAPPAGQTALPDGDIAALRRLGPELTVETFESWKQEVESRRIPLPPNWWGPELVELLPRLGLRETASLIGGPAPTPERLEQARVAIGRWMTNYAGPQVSADLPYRDRIANAAASWKGELSWNSAEALGKALANEQQRRERLTNELRAIEGVYRDPTASLQPNERRKWEEFQRKWPTNYPEGFTNLVRTELRNQLARILPPNPDSSLGLSGWQGWFQAAATNLGGLAGDLSLPAPPAGQTELPADEIEALRRLGPELTVERFKRWKEELESRRSPPPPEWWSSELVELLPRLGLRETASLIGGPAPTPERLEQAKAAIGRWMTNYAGPQVPADLPYRDQLAQAAASGRGKPSWGSAKALWDALATEQRWRERLTNELRAIEGVYREPAASLQPDEKLEWERFRGQWTTIYPEGFIALLRAELTNQLARILPPNPDSSLGLGDWQGWFQAAATNLGGLAGDLSLPAPPAGQTELPADEIEALRRLGPELTVAKFKSWKQGVEERLRGELMVDLAAEGSELKQRYEQAKAEWVRLRSEADLYGNLRTRLDQMTVPADPPAKVSRNDHESAVQKAQNDLSRFAEAIKGFQSALGAEKDASQKDLASASRLLSQAGFPKPEALSHTLDDAMNLVQPRIREPGFSQLDQLLTRSREGLESLRRHLAASDLAAIAEATNWPGKSDLPFFSEYQERARQAIAWTNKVETLAATANGVGITNETLQGRLADAFPWLKPWFDERKKRVETPPPPPALKQRLDFLWKYYAEDRQPKLSNHGEVLRSLQSIRASGMSLPDGWHAERLDELISIMSNY